MTNDSILIISGTNRKDAVSLKIAKFYRDLVLEKGGQAEVVSLADLPDDFIANALYENSGKNVDFNPLRSQVKAAQKMVFIVPEYNGSFPGVLKTFIDGLEFPGTFTGKKIALTGVSSGIQGAVLAMSHLTDIFNYCGSNVLGNKPKLFGINTKMKDDTLTDDLYVSLLKEQIDAFLAF